MGYIRQFFRNYYLYKRSTKSAAMAAGRIDIVFDTEAVRLPKFARLGAASRSSDVRAAKHFKLLVGFQSELINASTDS